MMVVTEVPVVSTSVGDGGTVKKHCTMWVALGFPLRAWFLFYQLCKANVVKPGSCDTQCWRRIPWQVCARFLT